MIGLLVLVTLLAGSETAAQRPRILTPEENAAIDRARRAPEPGFSRIEGTHCRLGEQVIYSCDLAGRRRVSLCRSEGTVLYRFGPKGRPEIELGRSTAPVTNYVRTKDASQFSVRFPNGRYSYSIYDLSLGVRGRQTGVTVARDGEVLTEHRCARSGPMQRLEEGRVRDLADDTDPLYQGW